MMDRIFIEQAMVDHPRVQRILSKYPKAKHIVIDNYGEVFNPKAQSFRQQKEMGPALILAEKQGQRVLSTPEGFGIGHQNNYYFSHLLNCPYDCRYCFLQGMYSSAHWVLFVNYEDFMEDILEKSKLHPDDSCVFFSGYDGDSLALEALSGFCAEFVEFFRRHPSITLELRSKSMQIRSLLSVPPCVNVVPAFSLSPSEVARQVDCKAPSIEKRLGAIKKLVSHGWRVGVRLDPMIYTHDFEQSYADLIDALKSIIPQEQLHSVSIGSLRFPKKMLNKLQKMYPKDRLLNYPFDNQQGVLSYASEVNEQLKVGVRRELSQWVSEDKIFSCEAS